MARSLVGLGLALACARPAPPPALPPAPPPQPTACEALERLTVYKSERRLVASCRGGAERIFPVSLSREPDGPKRLQGDQRVPEGAYRVSGPARPSSRFHLFLPIDYPSTADADRALAEGRISRSEHDAIARAHAEGSPPPHDTALGGHIGIHGEGPRWEGDLDLDWTEGCVAVTDPTIDWLATVASPGTPVDILP